MELQHGEGTVEERGGKYRARWWDGETRRGRTFPTREAAVAHLATVTHEKRLGRYVAPSALTVEALVHQYLARNRSGWASSTVNSYRRRVAGHLTPHLGQLTVGELTTGKLQRWVDKLNRTLAPTTVGGIVRILSGALAEAVQLELVPRNAAQGLKLAGEVEHETDVWTSAQARTVIEGMAEDRILGAFYALAVQTGLRPGELRALAWRDVDWSAARLTVRRTITRDEQGREVVGARTKSGRARGVALSEASLAALRRHRAWQAERRLAAPVWHDEGLVFDRGNGRFIAQSKLDWQHKRICERFGVPVIRLHDLRHTAATLALEANVHPLIVSQMLGHRKVEITLDRYSHVSVDLQRAAAQALGEKLAGRHDEAGTG